MTMKEQPPAPDGPVAESANTRAAPAPDAAEETVAEQPDGAEAAALPETAELSLEALQEQLAEERQKAQEYLDHLQRLQAEFQNYRRRVSQEQLQAAKRGKADLLRALLPVVSNFQLALQHAEEDPSAVRQGVQMIWQQIESFLREQGVERIDTLGQAFDPTKHEALSTAPATEDTPPNTIVAEISAGYLIEGDLLRPAQVVVARAEEPGEAADAEAPPPAEETQA